MATKSTRSSGTQHNQRGVAQGNTLVDPVTGLPVSVIDDSGIKRLAVDANVSLNNVTVNVDLDYQTDSVSIGDPNTNTTLKVNADGSIDTNVKVDASDGDNIAISDGTNTLSINPDGSLNVVTTSFAGTQKYYYNEVTAVPSAILTTVQTYTVPALTSSKLRKVEVSGTNIATYTIEVNAVVKAKKRTYFGNSLNEVFEFDEGVPLVAGDIVTIRVIHGRSFTGDFNSRIQVVEV